MRRSLKSFGIVVPCALGILGLLVGGSSLWEQNTGFNPATTFITQSLKYELYDDVFDLGSGEVVICGDGVVDAPEQCETNEQCMTGSSCLDCMCQPNPTGSGGYTGNGNPGGGWDSMPNSNPNWGWNSMPNSNPGSGGFNSSASNTNWFIDLSLSKELLGISKSGIYKYRVTVSNNGNVSAFNFTVKDYVSSNAFVLYASEQGLVQNNTITWSVDALHAGESKVFVLELKKIARGEVINKAEVCDYEGAGGFSDPDSNPCTMGADGVPGEDDEAVVSS